MGLDAGTVLAGGAGSLGMGRLEPSLVGGAVSTASRLQGMAHNHERLGSTRRSRARALGTAHDVAPCAS